MTQQQTRSRREPDDEVTSHEQELAEYLRERIKPGLSRGAIPRLARSIAKEIVDREQLDGGPEDDEAEEQPAEADEEPTGEADDDADADGDESEAEADDDYEDELDEDAETDAESGDEGDAPLDFEAEMHELQAELGDDWILRFSVQGDEEWLTAEKTDGSQHVEAPTAEVLLEAVELLEEGGNRSS